MARRRSGQDTKMSRRLSRARRANAAILVWLQIALLVAAPAVAGPRGERVIRGDVSFTRQHAPGRGQNRSRRHHPRIPKGARGPVLNLTTITASDGSVIEYLGGFNILEHEIVRFIQPDASSIVTNIDRSANATLIQGILLANGIVILLNRFGVFIDNTAVISTAHLLAAAGEVSSDGGFHAPLRFDLYGDVVNRGSIQADSVTLLGRRVANHGQIVAQAGSVLLAAGDDIWLSQLGSPVLVQLSRSPDSARGTGPLLENSGEIDAGVHRIRLAAGDALGVAIRNTGALRAGVIQLTGGETGTLAISGELDARNRGDGQHGGLIEVTGENVALLGASLDASGDAGGGVIHLGGERHGAGELRKASQVIVDGATQIRADALDSGDGGEVIVWSEDQSQVYGEISARGGENGGDGGFVETSSRRRLVALRAPDVSAPKGTAGEWLIDPVNIEIRSVPEGCSDNISPFCNPDVDAPEFEDANDPFNPIFQANSADPSPSIVSTEAIVAALGRGGQVTITTALLDDGGDIGPDEGTIKILDDIIVPPDPDETPREALLRLSAADSIYIGATGLEVDEEGNYVLPSGPDNDPVTIENLDPNLRLAVRMVANEQDLLRNEFGVTFSVTPQPELGQQNSDEDLKNENFYKGDIVLNGRIATDSSIPASDISQRGTREDANLELFGVRVVVFEGSSLETNIGTVRLVGNNNAFFEESFPDRFDGGVIPDDVPPPEVAMYGTIESKGGFVQIISDGDVTVGNASQSGDAITTGGGGLFVESALQTRNDETEEISNLKHTHIAGGLSTGSGNIIIVGDRITIDAPISTDGEPGGGGLVQLAVGLGDLTLNDNIVTRGGDVRLDSQSVSSTFIAEFLEDGTTDCSGSSCRLEFDRNVTIAENVLIDTRSDSATADDGPGGSVGIEIDGRLNMNGLLRSGGGDVSLNVRLGSIELDGTIDAVGTTPNSEGVTVAGDVDVDSSGNLIIGGDLFGNALLLKAGSTGNQREANLSFKAGSAPTLRAVGLDADSGAAGILLQAGNLDGEGPSSTVEGALGNLTLEGTVVGGNRKNPIQFEFRQDADILPDDLPDASQFAEGSTVDVVYKIESQGKVTLAGGKTGGSNLVVTGADFDATSEINPETLELIINPESPDETTAEFEVTAALALNLRANEIRIASADDLRIGLGATLVTVAGVDTPAGTIELRSGTDGTGDLNFDGDATLVSDHVALRAGTSLNLLDSDGNSIDHNARIILDDGIVGTDLPQFDANSSASAEDRSFEFVQNADIDDAQLPFPVLGEGEDGHFDTGIAGMTISLRSTNGGIDIGGESDLDDTNLSLLARDPVNLGVPLKIRSLEVGGTESFEVTAELLEKIQFTDEVLANDTARLTLRAGADTRSPGFPSALSFLSPEEGPLTIAADEITLFAGGQASRDSHIDLGSADDLRFRGITEEGAIDDGESPHTFVFRQQRRIADASLPTSVQFGSEGPRTYGIRSDFDSIALSKLDVADGPAMSKLILSAATVTLGDDPDAPSGTLLLFKASERSVEIRSDEISFLVSGGVDASGDAEFSGLALRGFDEGSESQDFKLGELGDELPTSFTIFQDNGIRGAMLPHQDVFGDRGPRGVAYRLESDQGEIDLRTGFERANGSALVLQVNSRDKQIFLGNDHKLKSLQATTNGDWRLNEDVKVNAEENIFLGAGCADSTDTAKCSDIGDLLLDGSATDQAIILRANVIQLQSGGFEPSKVVVNGENLSFELVRGEGEEQGASGECLGSPMTCFLLGQAAPLDSLELPIAGAFRKREEDGVESQSLAEIDLISLGSSSLSAESVIDGGRLANIRARKLQIASLTLRLEDPNFQHSDFQDPQCDDPDPMLDEDTLLSNTTLIADRVTVEATNGYVPGNDPSFILQNIVPGFAPSRFELIQTEEICASHLPSPALGQFTSSGIGARFAPDLTRLPGMEYLILSKGVTVGTDHSGNITADGDFAARVRGSQLELQAGPGGTVELSGSSSFVLESFEANLFGGVDHPDTKIVLNVFDPDDPENEIETIGTFDNQEFGSPVELEADTFLNAGPSITNLLDGGIFFGDTVTSGNGSDLTARATTAIAFAKDVGVVEGDDDSDAKALGKLELIGRSEGFGFVFGEIPEVDAAGEIITDLEEDELERLTAPVHVKTTGDIIFRLDVINSRDEGRAAPFAFASIFKFFGQQADPDQSGPVFGTNDVYDDPDLFFDAGGNFSMGKNEKLSMPGSLRIRAGRLVEDGTATLGDVSAIELRVEAPTIELQLRDAGRIQRQDGSFHEDGGVDYIANKIWFSASGADVKVVGSGAAPLFGLPDPTELPDFFLGRQIYPTAQAHADGSELTAADFFLDPQTRTLLDLQAEGATLADVSEAFWIAPPQPAAYRPVIGVVADPEPLQIVGIVSTPPSASDYEARLRGGAIFDDVARGAQASAGTARVSQIRLIPDAVNASVAIYHDALGLQLEFALPIRAIFQQALDDYRALTGARRVVGFEFRRYLRNRPNSQFEAYQALEKLDALFRNHRRSGLVPAEFARIQHKWLLAIQPEGITLDELSQTIFPSRYVRGSDILDVFGE